MDFVRIESLDDVTPHVSFERGFVVSRRADHTVVDYVYVVPETFSTAIALECRGLKFDRDGRIVGRPFHKFFNLGERERIEDVDWTRPHAIEDKLDGSMVHPVLLDGAMTFMTRMGPTAQAAVAQAHADAGVLDLAGHLLGAGMTPIFEFTSPDNRIVVAYDRAALTLLAARELVSGRYLPRAELAALGARFEVPVVAQSGAVVDPKSFVARTREAAGIEGYVIAFDDGHRLKLKTDGYALRHKALAGIQHEKNVLAWVVEGAVDDVVAILPEDIAARVLAYQAAVDARAAALTAEIEAFVAEHGAAPRKEFAALAFQRLDRRLTGAAFAALDGKDPRQSITALLAGGTGSDTKVEAIRDLFGMRWSVEGLDLPDIEP